MRGKRGSIVSHRRPTGDLAHNSGMCPDRESNQQPFSLQAGTQSTEPHQPGLINILNDYKEWIFLTQCPFHFIWFSSISGTNRYFNKVASEFGLKISFVDCSKTELLEEAITPKTKVFSYQFCLFPFDVLCSSFLFNRGHNFLNNKFY